MDNDKDGQGAWGNSEGKLQVHSWSFNQSQKQIERVKGSLQKARRSTMAGSYPEGQKSSFTDSRSETTGGA